MFGFGAPGPAKPEEAEALRTHIESEFQKMSQLIGAIRKPLPTQTGDGTYIEEEGEPSMLKDIMDLRHFNFQDFKSIVDGVKQKLTGADVDDKTYWMESFCQLAAKLPTTSDHSKRLTNQLVSVMWNDLQHPPQSYLSDKYAYRQADGSCNSLLYPDLGKAGTPYARTVEPLTVMPGALPDPSVIFDSLMARKGHKEHPNQISSVLFYFASIIIHDLFRTDHVDPRISNTSSYLDLAPLYGSNQDEQDKMRTFKDGKIKPDCFSESRLLSFPPGVGCLLIMFNRFHNYTVEQLALINEGQRFSKPREEDEQGSKRYDNDLFQTGRLITCGLYINIILLDYIRTILNLNQTNSNWQLNPRVNIKDGPPRGVGNQVSAEFNLVYRWHSAISPRDEKWTEDLYKKLFDGRSPEEVPIHGPDGLLTKLKELERNISDDPLKRDFAGLKRGDDNKYNDDQLVEIIASGIEDCSGAFGAQRIPTVLKAVEVLGMQQARRWNVASLNEFRKYFGLKPHTSFESINPDPEVANTLKHLYDQPDFVELYPGLVAEDAKESKFPGSGLCLPFTISRAVLSDATALSRGDRFYTIDYHPRKLTNWGFSEVNPDPKIDNGCVFYKLFLRAFPNHFEPNSIYAHYPLTIPKKMESVMHTLGKADIYSFKRPVRIPEPTMTFSYSAAQKILNDQQTFNVTWGTAMKFVGGPYGANFMLAGDGPANRQSRQMMGKAIYIDNWQAEVKAYYENITKKLLKQKSYRLGKVNQVDIIRDVGNLAHVHFCADLFSMPLKTEEHPLGIFTEKQFYLVMAAIFIVIFFDMDPAKSFAVHVAAHEVTQKLGHLVEANVNAIKDHGVLSGLMQLVRPQTGGLTRYGIHMIQRLLDTGMDVHELVWGHIIGTAGGMVNNQGQLFAQCLDYYLTEGSEHLPRINELAKMDTPEADEILMRYMMEGARIYGETGVSRVVTQEVTITDTIPPTTPDASPQEITHTFKPGDKIIVNLKSASRDPTVFPDPDRVVLDRPIDDYIHLGAGPHACLGIPIARISLTAMLKVIGRLDGLRPAPGLQGKLAKVPQKVPGYHAYLTEDWGTFFPFPTSMKVNWDGQAETPSLSRPAVRSEVNPVELNEREQLSAADLFILEPQHYFNDVARLQSTIFELGKQALGEIRSAGQGHQLDLRGPFTSLIRPGSGDEKLQRQQALLERELALVSATLQGLQILKESRFCGLTYSIIVVDDLRGSVLRLVPISASTLQLLRDLLEEAISCCRTYPTDWLMITDVLTDLYQAVALLTCHLGLRVHEDDKGGLSVVSSVLFLGLVSFLRSHVKLPSVSSDQESFDELRIKHPSGQVFMSPRRLACLDACINNSVWTFGTASIADPSFEERTKPHSLSTLLADFADLWGPVSLEYLDDKEDLVSNIHFRGGVIRSDSDISGDRHSIGETPCHWFSWTDAKFHRTAGTKPIITTQPLLIGTPSVDTIRLTRDPFCIHDICRCGNRFPYVSCYRAFELKTKLPSWTPSTRAVQASGGQYITIGVGQTWKFDAGLTMKDVIVNDRIHSPFRLKL